MENNAPIRLADTKVNYTIKNEGDGTFAIYDPDITGDHRYLHMNGNEKVVGWGESGAASRWLEPVITEVEVPAIIDITFTLTDPLGTTYTGTATSQDGAVTLDLGNTAIYTLTNGHLDTENKTYTANVTFNVPFPVSSATQKNWTYIAAYWSDTSKQRWYVESNDATKIRGHQEKTTAGAYNADANPTNQAGSNARYRWTITPLLSDGHFAFRIYNEATGKYIKATAGQDCSLVGEAEATPFTYEWDHRGDVDEKHCGFMMPNSHFCLSVGSQANLVWLNSLDCLSNTTHLGFNTVFETPYDFDALTESLRQNAEAYPIGTGTGRYTAPTTGDWLTAKNNADGVLADGSQIYWRGDQFETCINTLSTATPRPTLNDATPGFYRLRGAGHSLNVDGDFYLSSTLDAENKLTITATKDASTIVYYKGDTNGMSANLMTYDRGYYMQECGLAAAGGGNAYVVAAAPEATSGHPVDNNTTFVPGQYSLHYWDGYIVDWGNGNVQKCTDQANKWIGWQLEPVATLPLTIKEAGYTTFSAPVAVAIPEDVTAYVVTSINAQSVTLEEVSGNVEANTGLVLYKQGGGDIELAIAESGAAPATNLLHANVAAASYAAGANYYLGTVEGRQGFYKAPAGILLGHKAYLETPATAVKEFLGFDTATGLDAIQNSKFNVQNCFDLSGRQLPRLQKGVNIVNGKKIIVK